MTECDTPVPGIPVPGNSSIFLMVSEPESKIFGTKKSIRTGIEKNRYRKKSPHWSRKNLIPKKILEPASKFFRIFVLIWVSVSSYFALYCMLSEPVWKKFGTEKSLGICIVQILGLATHWYLQGITCGNFWQLLAPTNLTYHHDLPDLPTWPTNLTYLPDLPTWQKRNFLLFRE